MHVRAKKAIAEATAKPPSLSDLIELALPAFVSRGQHSFYRSTLRAAVKKLDKVKPARSFGGEWKTVLEALQQAGKLSYVVLDDQISMPEPS